MLKATDSVNKLIILARSGGIDHWKLKAWKPTQITDKTQGISNEGIRKLFLYTILSALTLKPGN
jgi:hypothetical protein